MSARRRLAWEGLVIAVNLQPALEQKTLSAPGSRRTNRAHAGGMGARVESVWAYEDRRSPLGLGR